MIIGDHKIQKMSSFVACNEESFPVIHSCLQKINIIIQEYRWIINAYVSDFYTHNHFHLLLHSVQEYFDAVEPPDLAWMLTFDKNGKHQVSNSVVPLSLLALHCCIQSLSLNRTALNMDSSEIQSSLSLSLCCTRDSVVNDRKSLQKEDNLLGEVAAYKPNYKNGQYMDMQHIFRKHVKPKKQHEIHKLGQVISLLSKLSSCSNVVDVGAGLGHLSRLLTFWHGLKVTTVEAVDGHAPVAAAYDRELKKNVCKVNEKRKFASKETASSNKSVKTSENLNTVGKHSLQNERKSASTETASSVKNSEDLNTASKHTLHPYVLPSHGNPSFECNAGGNTNCSNLNMNTKSVTYLKNVEHKISSSLAALKDNENETNCDNQSSIDFRKRESECYEMSGVGSLPFHLMSDVEDVLPNHVVFKVQPDIASAQFLDIIRQQTQTNTDKEDETSKNFILVGLHACGDLTPTLLRVFVNCKTAVGFGSVACCYMKMSPSQPDLTNAETANLNNYPMSKFVKGLPHYQLSYAARELACHFADAYYQRLKDNSRHLRIHSFRAALQYLIKAVNPEFKSGTVRLDTKKQTPDTFLQYINENLKKVNIDISTVPQDLIEHCDDLQKFWKRVVAFYTFRLSLAPAIETLILLDRALFLLENGIQCALVPVFDCSISPRNFALLAVKQQKEAGVL